MGLETSRKNVGWDGGLNDKGGVAKDGGNDDVETCKSGGKVGRKGESEIERMLRIESESVAMLDREAVRFAASSIDRDALRVNGKIAVIDGKDLL